jgi:hypothetical protein
MQTDRLRQSLNLFFALAQPILGFIGSQEFLGSSIGAISARYPTYVVPAGYAFTIWSLIYALSLGYGFWQFMPAQRSNPLLRKVGWFTAPALALTSVWIIVFQQLWFAMSVVIMLVLLGSLIGVIVRLPASTANFSRTEFWLVYVHFSIFLGWITIATVANIGQALTAAQWSGWGVEERTWGIIILLAAGVIAAWVTAALRGNRPYALTVIWALLAVAVKQFSSALATSSNLVGIAAIGAILFVIIASLRHYSRSSIMNDTPLQT